ncbi:MAG TPA: hypothetical protein VES20_01155 [Bryobacteraceae bacterium]|nr:hypothetical protein [Bryobacteraceae bacterium]
MAAKVQEHYANLEASGRDVQTIAPDASTVEEMIDAAFWASLRREEGYVPTISLALVSPDCSERPMMLDCPVPLLPDALSRLAPAVKQPGIHLGVSHHAGGLRVWGTTRSIPAFCFVLEVIAPGLLVVKHRRSDETGKFTNVAVVQGDEIKVLLQERSAAAETPELVQSLLGFNGVNSGHAKLNVLEQLATAMRAHRRGGALLVVPANNDTWRSSVVQPMRYAVSPAYCELTDLVAGDATQGRFRRAIDSIAGLTVVDGATVITDRYELLAFGVKIIRRDGWPQVTRVMVAEPVEGANATLVHPSTLGGTRHLSAAQFVQDQRDAIALVASQDERFTIFSWSASDDMLYAHRVESLLL